MANIFIFIMPAFLNLSFLTFLLMMVTEYPVSNAVEIRRLSVPRWIENGSNTAAILDCEYVYNENDLRLVVKWFFEDDLIPIYQWIPELNLRQISDTLRDRLDLDFAVNTADAYSRLRALKIKRPSTELSGKYTCFVASLAGQDSKDQVMTVFVPAKDFELSYVELIDESINVTCEATRLFPTPVLSLCLRNFGDSKSELVTDSTLLSNFNTTGTYDALLHRTFSADELLSRGVTVIECYLEIPGTNYVRLKSISYFPGNQRLRIDSLSSANANTITSTISLISIVLVCLIIISSTSRRLTINGNLL